MRQAMNESQKTPNDYAEAVRAFRLSVNELRLMHDYTPFNTANMNQTMVRMDCPSSQTNNIIGESSVWIANTRCARRGSTVALAACTSAHKLLAFVILKERSGRILRKAFTKIHVPEFQGLRNIECTGRMGGRAFYTAGCPAFATLVQNHTKELQAECYSLLFDTDSDGSFDGFESE
ncbi:hypothetical protein MRX96_039970 [Rhipicephalus microplus]